MVAVLRQRRRVADQSGLNSRQRLDNLAGALTVAPGGGRLLAEGLVVLVDDLMTTGASLTEAARAVRETRTRENPGPHRERMRAGHRDQRQQGRGVGRWRRTHGLVTGSWGQQDSVSKGTGERTNGAGDSGRTVDAWRPDATAKDRASCTPLQLGKAWGNGWSQWRRRTGTGSAAR